MEELDIESRNFSNRESYLSYTHVDGTQINRQKKYGFYNKKNSR
jgi:hypothetical protein